MFIALLKRYEAEIEDAVYRIDAINEHNLIIPEHTDILGEVDKMLQKICVKNCLKNSAYKGNLPSPLSKKETFQVPCLIRNPSRSPYENLPGLLTNFDLIDIQTKALLLF